MPLSTRLRSPGTTDGTAGQQVYAAMPTVAKPADNNNNNNIKNNSATATYILTKLSPNNDRLPPVGDDVGAELPPAKRRKVAIRDRQATLDQFIVSGAGSAPPPKPPARLSRSEPHGPLLQTINGVRKLLDIDEDEISQADTRSRASSKAPPAQKQGVVATAPIKQEDKRTLRSQDDGPKLKSDLAIYFSNYDEIIFDAPKEQELLTVNSVIHIVDESAKLKKDHIAVEKVPKAAKSSPTIVRQAQNHVGPVPTTPPQQRSISTLYNGSPSLDLDFVANTLPDTPEDPLTDDFYLKSHRRAERKEKQLRNIEKERAMHEKVQLDRLLDGLLGHDWLRVMGITAITDVEAKKYEPKREYFIAEVQALVDKFRLWKEQEKKQKLQKEAAAAASAREFTEDQDSESGSVGPPSSDLNASAALQLQHEASIAVKSATAAKVTKAGKKRERDGESMIHVKPAATHIPPLPPPPDIPITSFFAKRHLRDAALGKARHGRNVLAFGHPVPDIAQCEFALPDDFVTEDVIRANARERRRRKRASVTDGNNPQT